ncbi:MAG: hypothetical protein ACD_30C00002G0027 [uncultured bacterium]|uniref:Uncharacterized protein n=4 Tax=Candidatus Daviesiibacteriota TaxID=1752718 RepID=A0A0G0I2T2_9BACT|nr:MAG: hypothetical protein ACD_30C00002G0027 [uncultured bacterium]KKQ10421.1 MAG: hypothetical protein US19_C0005G0033 [Candidatus Daviesbacteria bacterium GW2011_GWB1_36_5]KKQ15801.1 MAG: hypothetical protein US28_C0010G0034 [Candidatus Daviesbacteria bacterium GW2011_GWA1_36_8]OGE16580.1 MAG: hypothetical protein A2858_01910 [Candidatus Daviesbacteria bacterium RIFCSPHIGHO2_01_FULL_36_37]OGE31739.1 MAG: hypothetical protein A3C99_02895 [Candidatus Daviesbacteria bacterium RIFCSPHIGHO2_02_F
MNTERIRQLKGNVREVGRIVGITLQLALDPRTDPDFIRLQQRWNTTRVDGLGNPQSLAARIKQTIRGGQANG